MEHLLYAPPFTCFSTILGGTRVIDSPSSSKRGSERWGHMSTGTQPGVVVLSLYPTLLYE